jgi:uncharacterized protein YcnI
MYTPSALILLSALATPLLGHIVFTPASGAANTTVYTSFRVSHGCNGTATTSVQVKLPAGTSSVKPHRLAGWTITTTTRPAENPTATVNTTVDTITWTSPEGVPDNQYEEFYFAVKTPATAGKIYFPVEQKCVTGSYSWTDIPQDGKPEPDHPAGTFTVGAAGATSGASSVLASMGTVMTAAMLVSSML